MANLPPAAQGPNPPPPPAVNPPVPPAAQPPNIQPPQVAVPIAVPVAPALPQWQVRAQALGLNPDETVLYELMVNFLNFTEGQYTSLREHGGYGTLRDLNQWRYKDIKDWCVAMSNRPNVRGGRTYGDLKIRQLQAIAWWVTDCTLRNVPLDVNEFKANADDYKENAEYSYLESQADDVNIDKPAKFDYKNWIAWEESVYLYFDSIYNLRGVPLSYVIRKATPTTRALSRKEQIIYNGALHGFVFDMDSKSVLSVIKECTLDTEAETWIRNIRCGRAAMQALQHHYDGVDEARKRLDNSKAQLDKLFYQHEATFSFEKYVTALNGIYKIHERYNEPIYESDKVRYLLDKCQNNHVEFKQAVGICRTLYTNFDDAVTYLKTTVGRLFPDGGRGTRRRNISSANTKKGGSKRKMVNGVDCSDLSRWYSKEEFQKLPGYMRKKIALNKSHQEKNKDEIQRTKKARIDRVNTERQDSEGQDQESQNRLVAAMINGVVNASRHESGSITGSAVQFPLNGRNAQIAAQSSQARNTSSNSSSTSTVTFDHLGNPRT